MLKITATTLLATAAATAATGLGASAATAQTPTTTTAAGTPVTVTVASAREVSRARRRIEFTGRVGPTASLKGGNGSLILYRETHAGLQQLSFTGSQTRPKPSGTFKLLQTGEPTGHNTYVLVYVPSATGYAAQGVATIHLTVTG